MNRQGFIGLLEKRLSQLPQVEKEHLLNCYNETIEDHMEDDMSEAETVASLDSIDMIIKQVYAGRELPVEEGKPAARGNRRHRWKIAAFVLLSPFWTILLGMTFVIYLLLWTLLAVLFCIMPISAYSLVGALWNLAPVVRANAAVAVIPLDCMFLFSGLLPLCWKLLRIGTVQLKNQTGIWLTAIWHLFVKAVNQMKVTLRQLLKYIPVICILLGLLLIDGGFAMAGFKMENLQTVEHKPYMKRKKTVTVRQISSIRIDSCHSEINILPAEGDNIHIQYEENDRYPMNVTRDATSLRLKCTTRSFQFNFFDFDRELNIPIAIELPRTFHDKLDIDTSYGNVTVHDTAYQNIAVNNNHGNVSLSRLKAGAAAPDVTYGSVVLNDVNSRQTSQLNSEHSDIISKSLKADSAMLATAYSDITLGDTEIAKGMTLYHEYAPVSLGKLKAQALQIEGVCGDIRSTGLTIAESADFSLEHSDITLQRLSAENMTMENAYGDTMISGLDADSILMEGEHGSFSTAMKESTDDFNVLLEAEYGDNTLPAKYENSSRRKLQINVEYDDINVKFQKQGAGWNFRDNSMHV